uniref:Uncharacterized protein n=1 Tax=Ditylenchus dipsaci TaxID=166011 RepID=A0A915DDJ4_9BILA
MDNTISPSSSSSLLCVPLKYWLKRKEKASFRGQIDVAHKEAEHNKLHNVVSHLKFIRKKKKLRQIHNRSASQRRSVGSVLKLAAGLDAELEGEIKTIIVQMTQIRQQIQSTQAYIEYFEPPMQSEPSLHWEVKWADGSHDYHECRIPRTFFN